MMMAWIVFFLLLVPTVACLIWAVYLTVLLVAAVAGRNLAYKGEKSGRALQVVVAIPAYNEEQLVERTIESIKQCEYPPELREIVVIADNCTDHTAEIARECGVTVLERHNELLRGKGYALSFFIEQYLICKKDVNAVVVIDSDTVVSPNLLHVVSRYISGGAQAGQVRDAVGNAEDGWRPAMQFVSLALKGHVRALGRDVFGCSAGLFGNGMFFTRDLLVKEGWPANSIVEDTEFGLRLALEGIKVQYAPEATALALMPTSDAAGKTQKARWEFGQIRMAKSFVPRLARILFGKQSLSAFLWLLELTTPPLVPLFAIALTLFVTSCGAWILVANNLTAVLLLASGSSALLLSVYAVGGLLMSRAPWCVWRSLLALPLYVLWKVRVYGGLALKGGPKQWIRTDRH